MGRTSSGTVLLAFVAILCGLLGTYALRKMARPQIASQPEQRGPELITIPMASMDLQAGRQLTLGDIAIAQMTRSQMKERDIRAPFMSNTAQIIGRTLKEDLRRGDTFDTLHFYPEGLGPGVAEQLQSGERAVTVSIANENGLIGFAGAGQLVDVLFQANLDQDDWIRQRNANRFVGLQNIYQLGATTTLMQGVRVLALGNDTYASVSRNPSTSEPETLSVTLAVSPDQAEILRVVQGHGDLSLTLRNPNDNEAIELKPQRTLDDVLDLPEFSSQELEVYRGRHVDHLFFDRTTSISRRYGRNGTYTQQEPGEALESKPFEPPSLDVPSVAEVPDGDQADLSGFIPPAVPAREIGSDRLFGIRSADARDSTLAQ